MCHALSMALQSSSPNIAKEDSFHMALTVQDKPKYIDHLFENESGELQLFTIYNMPGLDSGLILIHFVV